MSYLFLLSNIALALAACGLSLSLLVQDAGMVSLAHAGFAGIGAYVYAIAVLTFGRGDIEAFFWATVAGAATGVVLGAVLARLQDDHLVLGTLAMQLGLVSIFRNWRTATNGNLGVSLSSAVSGRGGSARSLLIALVLVFVLAVCVERYRRLFGATVLHASRDDELLAESLGRNTRARRSLVMAVTAAAAAVAGAAYGRILSFLHPDVFSLELSLLLLAIVVLSVRWGTVGVILGAFFVICVPEALRFVPLDEAVRATLRQVFYNAFLAIGVYFVFRRRQLAFVPKVDVS